MGLIAKAGGDLAGSGTICAMLVYAAHVLCGTVAPVIVAVPQAWKHADEAGDMTDEGYGERLDKLGRLVVDVSARLRPEAEPEAQVLRASA